MASWLFSIMGPCLSSTRAHFSLPLPPQNLVDRLNIFFLETSNSMFTGLFSRCKLKWSRTSSTSNHRFYRALGRLHGPWQRKIIPIWKRRSQENAAISSISNPIKSASTEECVQISGTIFRNRGSKFASQSK